LPNFAQVKPRQIASPSNVELVDLWDVAGPLRSGCEGISPRNGDVTNKHLGFYQPGWAGWGTHSSFVHITLGDDFPHVHHLS